MLNQSGIVKETYRNVDQILFSVEHQVSVSIVVDDSTVSSPDGTGRKILKAGTPLTGDLGARTTPFTKASAGSSGAASNAVGVLLHDVDVTNGDANGTLLIFGFVNTDRINETTQGELTQYVKAALPMICFAAMDDKAEE